MRRGGGDCGPGVRRAEGRGQLLKLKIGRIQPTRVEGDGSSQEQKDRQHTGRTDGWRMDLWGDSRASTKC